MGKSGKVIAFEPEPNNFSILKKNISINNYDNIIAEQKIVSEKNGKVKLFVVDSGIVGHHTNPNEENDHFIELQSVTLDDYLPKLKIENKINFIKIDVEGAEPNVLQGSKNILNNNQHLKIFTEFNRKVIKKYNLDPSEMLSLLEENNFKFFVPNYKTNTLSITDNKTLLTSNELLKENLNILCQR